MSCGVSSRSTSRQHALRNSTVVTPVAMPGLSDGYLNLLPAENLSDHGHFEFERQGRAGHLFTCLDYSADDRQIDRCQQESRDRKSAGQGTCSLASITRLTTGKSTDVSRNR